MVIPNEAHPAWIKAISGQNSYQFEFLATKILMGRLSLLYQRDPSAETTKKSIAELRAFFEKNKDLPKAAGDLRKIFGEAVNK